MDKISVIVVTWNSEQVVGQCLSSLLAHAPAEQFELILVDNASANPAYLDEIAGWSGARVIRNQENLGFAKAVNIGARAATGTHLLLLNPDIVFRSNPFPRLLAELRNNPSIGAIGPLLRDTEGEPQILNFYPKLPTIGQYILYRSLLFRLPPVRKFVLRHFHAHIGTSGMFFVEQIPGAFLLFRRDLFGEEAVLNEAFFIWMEDVDFCLRLKQRGLKAAVLADESVMHIGGHSFQSWSNRRRLLMLNNSYLTYLEIHFKAPAYFAHVAAMAVNSLVFLAITPFYHAPKGPKAALELTRTWALLLRLIAERGGRRLLHGGRVRRGEKTEESR